MRSVDLTTLVDECLQVFGLTYDVPVDVDESGPVFGRGDPVGLRRAIGNVLDNALRAAGDQGTVHVKVSSDDHTAAVEVSDNGTGLRHRRLRPRARDVRRGHRAPRLPRPTGDHQRSRAGHDGADADPARPARAAPPARATAAEEAAS